MIHSTHQKLIEKVSGIFKVSNKKTQVMKVDESVSSICFYLEVEISEKHKKNIFVKMGKEQFLSEENKHEIQFYQTLKEEKLSLAVPYCYFAGYDDQTDQSILILDDCSDSHTSITEWPIPAKISDCKRAISALAELHATFWNHPKLGKGLANPHNKNEMERDTAEFLEYLNELIDFLGDRINEQTIEIYKKSISRYYPLVSDRLFQMKHVTLCHQDSHIWNYLFSKKNDRDVYIIDWGSWKIGIGVDDLAYMIGLHWHPLRRKAFERSLIKFYHSQLIANGVKGYSFQTCYEDYRIAILGNHFLPLWQWKNGISAQYWWPHFERAPIAYLDLNCDDLTGNHMASA